MNNLKTADLKNKTCLITGGTSGIGSAIARGLAARGANVIVVGRNPTKGQAAVTAMRSQTGNASIEFMQADLFSQKSIRALAAAVARQHQRLDILVNNVGGAFWKRGVTEEGIERTLALNLLTPFLLTQLLLPLMEKSAPARIINIATKPRNSDTIDFDDLQAAKKYNPFGAYGKAKTGLIMYTYELARRLKDSGITVNCVHPGIAPDTDFGSDMPKILRTIGPIFARLAGLPVVSQDAAADTAIYLATSAEVATTTGKYFFQRQPMQSLPQTYDPVATQRLWDSCAQNIHAG